MKKGLVLKNRKKRVDLGEKALILPPTWEQFLSLTCSKLKVSGVSRVETTDGAEVEALDEVLPNDHLLIIPSDAEGAEGGNTDGANQQASDDATPSHAEVSFGVKQLEDELASLVGSDPTNLSAPDVLKSTGVGAHSAVSQVFIRCKMS